MDVKNGGKPNAFPHAESPPQLEQWISPPRALSENLFSRAETVEYPEIVWTNSRTAERPRQGLSRLLCHRGVPRGRVGGVRFDMAG
jgi:hypothetical protein